MKKAASIFVLLISLTALLFAAPQKLKSETITIVKKDGTQVTIQAEMARTDSQRMKGLMERRHIPDGTGMLFIFAGESFQSFWMKNTPSPLSIAYIRADGTICDILDMKPFDLTPVESTKPAQYALEVPLGYFRRVNINVGDKLKLDF